MQKKILCPLQFILAFGESRNSESTKKGDIQNITLLK